MTRAERAAGADQRRVLPRALVPATPPDLMALPFLAFLTPRGRARPFVRRGDAARSRGSWSDAASAYQDALRRAPEWEAIWVQLGHMRKEAGDLAGAERAYGRALKLAPGNADTWINAGHLLKRVGRHADAAAAYGRADVLAPGDPELARERIALSRAGFRGDGPTPALAVEAPQGGSRPLARLGRSLGLGGDKERSRKAVAVGDAARDRGDWSTAAARYAEAVAADPSLAHIWVQLGHMRKEAGDPAGAETAYGRALSLKPYEADTWLNVGLLFKLQQRWAEAADAYARAAELDPELGSSGDELVALARQGVQPTGRTPRVGGYAHAGVAVASAPRRASTRKTPLMGPARSRYNRARTLWREGDAARDRRDWPAAAAAYRRALAVAPERAAIWVQLGHAEKESGDLEAAERAYGEALSREPDNGDTHLNLGHLLKTRGRWPDAYAAYKRAVELEPDRPDWQGELLAASRRVLALEAEQAGPASAGLDDPLLAFLREVTVRGSAARAIASLPPVEFARVADALDSAASQSPSGEPAPSREAPASADAQVLFDVADLLEFFRHSRLPTGIQRVQIETVSAVLRAPLDGARVGVVAFSEHLSAWSELPQPLFLEVCRLALSGGDVMAVDWRIALGRLEVAVHAAGAAAFGHGSTLVSLGASWAQGNYFLALRAAKARWGLRYVPFLHDLIPVFAPGFHVEDLTRDFIGWLQLVLAHADGYLANSRHTLNDLREAARRMEAPFPADRTEVVHLDARIGSEIEDHVIDDEVLRKFGLERGKFVLFVSTIEPRKNHLTAFGAWEQLIRDHGARAPKLVCVGGRGWMNENVIARLRMSAPLREKVQIATGVPDHELATLYKACAFTLYPSSYEGWGLPITESLCYGKVPLISDAPSLREAGAGFAELFELGSERRLAAAADRLYFDEAHRRAAETRIAHEFRPRAWSELGAQIVGAVRGWRSGELRADKPFPLPLGRHHALARNSRVVLGPELSSGEAFRRGDGWNQPEWWGTWTKPAPALLAFSVAPGDAPLRLYLGLRGPLPCDSRFRVTLGGETLAEGRLEPGRVQWICRTLPASTTVAGELVLAVTGDASWPLEGREEPRTASIGVVGLMLCLEDDLLARSAFVEEHLSDQLKLLA